MASFELRSVESKGIVLRRRRGRGLTLSYGEILTAERLPQSWRGLRLHTRTTDPLRVKCKEGDRENFENDLRRRGVRIVDEWGALLTPTLDDFLFELAREPVRVRQSSDSA